MAINRISGRMLQENLQRDNDLSVQGDLLYLDIGNSHVGIGTTEPNSELEVVGNILVGNTSITSTGLSSTDDLIITPTGNVDVSNSHIKNLSDPVDNTDAVTKQFLSNSIADSTFSISDNVDSTTIAQGDTITIQGTANQITSELTGNVFTIGLPDNVTIDGNLTINDTLVVDGIDIGNNISGGGNLSLPGEIEGNTFIANSALTLPYLNDNALVFTDDTDTLITYADIRYDGGNSIDISNVSLNVDNVTIVGNSIVSTDNLNFSAGSGQSVVVTDLTITDNNTPTLVCFIDGNGRVTTDSSLSFDDSVLTVSGEVNSTEAVIGNISLSNNRITSDGNLILSAESASFVTIDNTTGIIVPVGTTVERPADANPGTVRWNSDYNYLEVYDGSNWEALGTDVTFITSQVITGDDSTQVFTLDQEATTSGILVYINGVSQVPGSSYTVLADQITFVEAPQSQDTVEVRFISLSQTISALTNANGDTSVRVNSDDEISFNVEGNVVGNITSSSVNFSSTTPINVGSNQLGFLDSPQRVVSGNTTLTESDRGGHLYINSAGSFDIEIPNDTSASFPIGARVEIISHSTDNITLSLESGVDLYLSGNSVSSSRTIQSFGFARLIKVSGNTWSVFGDNLL